MNKRNQERKIEKKGFPALGPKSPYRPTSFSSSARPTLGIGCRQVGPSDRPLARACFSVFVDCMWGSLRQPLALT
jgi:hypothetical protein